jgi:hypothetical protein
VDLFVQVSRDHNGRLNGNVVVPAGLGVARSFSGTLELLRVLEDLLVSVTGSDETNQRHSSLHGNTRRKP